MGIATKKRRKIVVGGEDYLWWVGEGDGAGMILHVASQDKHFMVQYELRQPKGKEYLAVIGRRFAGASTGGCWKRFRCPRFEENSVMLSHVRNLIEWSLDESLVRVEVDYGGGDRMI